MHWILIFWFQFGVAATGSGTAQFDNEYACKLAYAEMKQADQTGSLVGVCTASFQKPNIEREQGN